MTYIKICIYDVMRELKTDVCRKLLLKRNFYNTVMHTAFSLLFILLFASCGNDKSSSDAEEAAIVGADNAIVAGQDDTIEKLLKVYDGQGENDRLATADKIFDLLFREEMTDERITLTHSTPSDSIDMLVWYWAGEHLWSTQSYNEGLQYAEKALPLTYKLGDLSLQSYCERLVGLFYFRRSDYDNAIEHVSKSLELSKKEGNNSQVGSSLNTLAGICLAAKQLDDGEKYIQEAIRYCEEANDSNLLPIRYGMASEIYHAKGDDVRSLNYARRAFALDSLKGNTPRMGIRLSQMAAARPQARRCRRTLSQTRNSHPRRGQQQIVAFYLPQSNGRTAQSSRGTRRGCHLFRYGCRNFCPK